MKQKLVTATTFLEEIQAELAKSKLDDEGIPCMIRKDDCGGMRPHLSFARPIELLVHEENLEKARKALSLE